MKTMEQANAVIETVFKDFGNSIAIISEYITRPVALCGICEEPEDVEYLEKSYEPESR